MYIDWIAGQIARTGIKQKEVGAALNLDPGKMSKVMSGNRRLQAHELQAAADLFGTTVPTRRRPIVNSFDPDELEQRITEPDPLPHDHSGRLIDLRDLPAGSIPELVAEGGMGPGHIIQSQEHGDLYAQDEIKDEFWSFPQSFVRSTMGTTAANLIAIACTGDSMEPTLKPNERVWVNVSHRRPTPDGIYAIRDALGAPVIKRLELGEGDPPTVRVISDNPLHSSREISINDLQIIGKVVAGLRLF